jgi:hypothetical protein
MNRQRLWESIIVAVIGLVASSASGLDFMGPPRSNLDAGQLAIGLDYMFSDTDLGSYPPVAVDTAAHLHVNKVFATLAYGFTRNVDVYVSPGIANASGTGVIGAYAEPGHEYVSWDLDSGSTRFAWRVGQRATFFDWDKTKIGGLMSFSRMSSEGQNPSTRIELDEFQAGVGPTVILSDDLSLYGGLVYRHLDGATISTYFDTHRDLNINTFGGFMGAQFELNAKASLMAEFQYVEDAVGFGTGLLWRVR